MQVRSVGAVTVAKPEGPLTTNDADEFKERLLDLIGKNLGRIVIDASAVSHVDSKGLESLLDITEELAQSGKVLKLCDATETVRETIEVTGLSSQFEHFEGVNSAVRSFI
jgi:anti-sigma B factor antagonist